MMMMMESEILTESEDATSVVKRDFGDFRDNLALKWPFSSTEPVWD